MTRRAYVALIAVTLAVTASAVTASAADAVQSAITIPSGQPTPIITQNGTPYAQGTYAIGTIQLLYTVNALQFTTGQFACFNVGLSIDPGPSTGTQTAYSVNFLTLTQTGSSNVILTPDTAQFSVSGAAWSDGTRVCISIPSGVPSDDGTVLVGNLQMDTPAQSHLKTTTSIQVKIMLVHPDPVACLKFYDFITDESFTTLVTSTTVNVNGKGKITATNPYGQFSDNLLVVNTCPTDVSFNLVAALSPWFSTNPVGNPGNATFTYFASGAQDPSTFNIATFGAGTKQGQALQFTNVPLPAGEMFLTTVHMGINNGTLGTGLGTSGTFTFTGTLSNITPPTAVSPSNPAQAVLSYVVK